MLALDESNADLWRSIVDRLDQYSELDYLGFIVIFGFSKDLQIHSREAVQRGLSAFACPFNPFVLEAHIHATFWATKSDQALQSLKHELCEAETLADIAQITFRCLDADPRIGYDRACISLIEDSGQRYLLQHDPFLPNPDRMFFKNIHDDVLLTRVVKNQVVILENLIDLRTHHPERLADIGWEQNSATNDVNSWLGLSIKLGKKCIGIITLDHRTPGHYQKHDDRLTTYLTELSHILANAIYDVSQQRNERILREMSYEIGNMLDSQSLIEKILERLLQDLDCSHCSYFKVSSSINKEDVFLEEWFNVISHEDTPLKVASRKRIFRKYEGVIGAVFADSQSRIVPHALEDDEFQPSPGFSGTNLSILAVPVATNNIHKTSQGRKVIGVIACYKREKDFFTIYDRELLESIARCAATVIERTMTLEYLNDISNKMNELALKPEKTILLKKICEHALKITSARAAVIHRFQRMGSTEDINEYASTGEYYSFPEEITPGLPRMHGGGTTEKMLKSGETAEFSRLFGNEECISENLRNKGVKYHIVVPLKIRKGTAKEEIIGALYLNKYNEQPFSDIERFALELFANQASNILYYQEFLAQKQTWARGNAGLAKAIEGIAKTDNPNLLIKDIAQYSCALSGATFSYVTLKNREGDLEIKATYPEYVYSQLADFLKGDLPKIESKKGIVGLCDESAQTILVEDVQREKSANSKLWQQYIEFNPEIRSELAVPIKENTSGKVIGVINLEHNQPYIFGEVHKEVIEHFARQVAIAFQKKHLVDSVNSKNNILMGLQRSLRKIIESPAQNMLENIVALTREAIDAESVLIFPVSRKQWSPSIAEEEIAPSIRSLSKSDFKQLKAVSMKVYASQQLELYQPPAADPHKYHLGSYLSVRQKAKAFSFGLCIPFSSRELRMGVMWILFPPDGRSLPTDEEKAIYQVYADQIALAFHNAQTSKALQDKLEKNKFELTKNIDKNYNDARSQAGVYFVLSVFSSVVGLLLIFSGFFNMFMSEDSDNATTQAAENWPVLAGVLLQGVTVFAFTQAEKANTRMDKYHKELFDVRQLEILLSATDQLDDETSTSVKREIVKTAANSWIQAAKQSQPQPEKSATVE
ncbi:MAG: GAF domain-containing protein [Leptolyngbyaceae cyanobacterium]